MQDEHLIVIKSCVLNETEMKLDKTKIYIFFLYTIFSLLYTKTLYKPFLVLENFLYTILSLRIIKQKKGYKIWII